MRVIDQNGCDYPYESIVISHGDGMIYARPVSNMEKQYFLARYSTKEKAEKAMQKLHECYTGVILLQNVGFPDDAAEQLRSMKNGFICVNNQVDNVYALSLCTQFLDSRRRTRYELLQTTHSKIEE